MGHRDLPAQQLRRRAEAALGLVSAMTNNQSLASWNTGAAKSAILDCVARVTSAGAADFVPPNERIVVFDNDGTLLV